MICSFLLRPLIGQKEVWIMLQVKLNLLSVITLSITYFSQLSEGYTEQCHLCLDDYEMSSAPMIDAYEGLVKRSEDAFAELEAAFDDDKKVEKQARQAEKRARRVQKQARQAEKRARRVQKQARQAEHRARRVQKQVEQSARRVQKQAFSRQEEISHFEAEVLRLVNQERAKGGYCADEYFAPTPALYAQRQLAIAAQQHGLAMSRQRFFSHYGQAGDTPKDRIIDAGYQGTAWGENIAAGQKTPQQVMKEWMDSPGHCRNILNGLFTELGVSFIFDPKSPYKTYWVQAFGRSR